MIVRVAPCQKILNVAFTNTKKFQFTYPRKTLTMSESLDDMKAYTLLTDSVLEHILFSRDPHLKPSKDILEKILTRQLYKCVGQTQPPIDTDTKLEVCLKETSRRFFFFFLYSCLFKYINQFYWVQILRIYNGQEEESQHCNIPI